MFDETNLISWWKKLPHNQKKNLIANFDFYKRKIDIKPYNDLYNQYKIAFGIGIRERLNNFEISKKNIREQIDIKSLVINHNSFLDFSITQAFKNLENLYFKNDIVENLRTLENTNIKTLSLSCAKLNNIMGIEKLENLEHIKLIYCYNLDNLNFIANCPKIIKIDLSYLGSLSLIDKLLNVGEIIISKNMMYPNEIVHTLYKYKYEYENKLYKFTEEEIEFILKNAKDKQKENYAGLILSEKYSVYIKNFTEWTLVKNKLH